MCNAVNIKETLHITKYFLARNNTETILQGSYL